MLLCLTFSGVGLFYSLIQQIFIEFLLCVTYSVKATDTKTNKTWFLISRSLQLRKEKKSKVYLDILHCSPNVYTYLSSRKVEKYVSQMFLPMHFAAWRKIWLQPALPNLAHDFLSLTLFYISRHVEQFAIPETCPHVLCFDRCCFFPLKISPLQCYIFSSCISKNTTVTPKMICEEDLWLRAQNSHLTPPLTNYMLKYKTECKVMYG